MALNSSSSMAVALFASVAAIVWAAAFAWTRWLVRPHQELPLTSQERDYRVDQRLESIEQALQAIAIEVERLGEGQRFTARLLADRLPADAAKQRLAAEHRRVDTPH